MPPEVLLKGATAQVNDKTFPRALQSYVRGQLPFFLSITCAPNLPQRYF